LNAVARLGLLTTLVAVSGCSPGAPSPSQAPTGSPGAPSPSQAPTGSAANALELLDCAGPPAEFGGLVEDHQRPRGGQTPAAAFDAWIADNGFGLPVAGYEAPRTEEDRFLFIYRVGEEVKVVVVVSPRVAAMVDQPFALDEVRMCDQAEFGAQVDFGIDARVWVNADGMILIDVAGPEHCGWSLARFLAVYEELPLWRGDFRNYIGDPVQILPPGTLVPPYDGDAQLPRDATDSGYRQVDLQLWLVPDGSAAYIVGPGYVELWPASDIGCS